MSVFQTSRLKVVCAILLGAIPFFMLSKKPK
jgi:hypothetical protein